jgi:hypothetical protein
MTSTVIVCDIYGVAEKKITDDLPDGFLTATQIGAAIRRACERVSAMQPSYRNILTQSASPTVRVPRKPVAHDDAY